MLYYFLCILINTNYLQSHDTIQTYNEETMSSNRVSYQSRSFNQSYQDQEDAEEKETEQTKYIGLYLTPQQALIINSKLPKMFSFQPNRKRGRRMINEAEEIAKRINERKDMKKAENNDSQGISNRSNLARKSERLVHKEKIVYYDLDKVSSESNKKDQDKIPQTHKEQPVKSIDNQKAQQLPQTRPQQFVQKPQKRSVSQKEPQHHQQQRPSKSQEKPKLTSQNSSFQQEWRILRLIKGHTYADPFLTPVDQQQDAAPNYYKIIKDPIDLQTIQEKLQANKYTSSFQFHSDLDKMWQNSYTFNRPKSSMHKLTKQIERFHHNLMNICSSSPKPSNPVTSASAASKRNKKQ